MSKTSARAGQSGKSIEEVVAYALGHRIRVQVLTILSEGVYTVDQLAELIGEPTNKVAHHVSELYDGGSIELAKTEPVRSKNILQHFYRAVEMPFYSDEQVAAMTHQQRQVHVGLVLQTILAEAMAAFWTGDLIDDPRIWLTSKWFNVDEQGREEIADEQARSWERLCQIEEASVNRVAASGGESRSVMAQQLGYFRERKGPTQLADKQTLTGLRQLFDD